MPFAQLIQKKLYGGGISMLENLSFIQKKLLILKNKYILPSKDKLSEELNLFFDDIKYKKHFQSNLGPMIYNFHVNGNLICCAFCSSLKRSECHEFCFKCSKGIYEECSPLLPGTFSFSSNYIDPFGEEVMPWIFKTPCTGFERIVGNNYFRNFISSNKSITMANFEVLEGLFTGISRDKKPCHICASVSLEIYKDCTEQEKESVACSKVSQFITDKYKVISGMIKFVE